MVSLNKADLILINGAFHTLDRENPVAEAAAIRDGKFLEVGSVAEVMQHHDEGTQVVDLQGHTAIPGLNDSHLHLIRGGLNYNLELRWEGVPSLADALRMLKDQALRTPSPQWVRVVGGWSEFQFAERRMPSLDEINEAAPDTPVFILHLYDRALLNRAALRAVGYTKDTPNPPGGEIQRDSNGNPTGMLIARPNAMILYSTLAKGPTLPLEQQVNSTRQFMRELNRLGLTSAIDAGGGFQNYPEDYQVISELHANKQLTIRIAYNLFTQRPGHELEDFEKWTDMLTPGQGKKGQIKVGQLADMAILSKDYFRVPEEEIKGIESVLTIVNGDIVYAAGTFGPLAPPSIPVLPDWSPVVTVPGHYRSAPPQAARVGMAQVHHCSGPCGVHQHAHDTARHAGVPVSNDNAFWGALGCSCFAF